MGIAVSIRLAINYCLTLMELFTVYMLIKHILAKIAGCVVTENKLSFIFVFIFFCFMILQGLFHLYFPACFCSLCQSHLMFSFNHHLHSHDHLTSQHQFPVDAQRPYHCVSGSSVLSFLRSSEPSSGGSPSQREFLSYTMGSLRG